MSGFRIINPESVDAAYVECRRQERADLERGGKITLRWLQSTASMHLYSGRFRPALSCGGFISESEAQQWLDEFHPGLKISATSLQRTP